MAPSVGQIICDCGSQENCPTGPTGTCSVQAGTESANNPPRATAALAHPLTIRNVTRMGGYAKYRPFGVVSRNGASHGDRARRWRELEDGPAEGAPSVRRRDPDRARRPTIGRGLE